MRSSGRSDGTSGRSPGGEYAPFFCNVQAIADDIFNENDVPFVRTLAGVGGAFGHPNLANINDDSGTIDMDRLTSGVDFLEGCDSYYHTPFDVRWDRDNNGSFETAGAAIDFDATAIDGPASFSIPVRAAHAVGGNELNTTAAVSVRNVAPAIAGFQVKNSAGPRIGIDVPFALVRTPLTVTASFTDPGKADHQTAQVNWADGIVENQTAFSVFSDAFDGATGNIGTPTGMDWAASALELSVTDDDGGADVESVTSSACSRPKRRWRRSSNCSTPRLPARRTAPCAPRSKGHASRWWGMRERRMARCGCSHKTSPTPRQGSCCRRSTGARKRGHSASTWIWRLR